MNALAINPGPPPALGRQRLRLAIPSSFDHLEPAIDAVVAAVVDAGFLAPGLETDHLVHCLNEAIANAVIHGNDGNLDLAIGIEVREDERAWHVVVADRGAGFCHADVPAADALGGDGRGIAIMRGWVDELAYWDGGACAVLTRRKAGASPAHSM